MFVAKDFSPCKAFEEAGFIPLASPLIELDAKCDK